MNHFWQNIDGWIGENSTYKRAVRDAQDGDHFVEIGVYKGKSTAFMAVEIVNSGKQISFTAIDHFKGSAEHGDLSATLYNEALKNLEPVKDVVEILNMSSPEAAELFVDDYVTFVFIDGSHDYQSVKADIEAWWPKVKAGGVLAGDDYQPSWPGVIQAVHEFSEQIGLDFYISPNTCHWVIKKPAANTEKEFAI